MNTKKLSKLLLDNLQYGGVTIAEEGKVLTTGIAVALDTYSEYTIRQWTKQPVWHINRWLKCQKTKGESAIGMWVDQEGMIYLDRIIVFNTTDLSAAITHASKLNQKAVHFLDQNITLWLTNQNKTT